MGTTRGGYVDADVTGVTVTQMHGLDRADGSRFAEMAWLGHTRGSPATWKASVLRRTRLPLLLLVLVLGLFAAACNGDDTPDDTAATPGSETPTETDAQSADLDEGVAATVNGEEISSSKVDERVQSIVDNPAAQEQFEGQDEETVRASLRSRVLTSLIANVIVSQGADDLGVEASDEDIAAARAQLEEIVGGEEELDEHLATTGVSQEQLDEELRVLALLDAVGEELSDAEGDDAEAQQQRQEAASQWLSERLVEADVQVDREYGAWDPSTRQVVPQSTT